MDKIADHNTNSSSKISLASLFVWGIIGALFWGCFIFIPTVMDNIHLGVFNRITWLKYGTLKLSYYTVNLLAWLFEGKPPNENYMPLFVLSFLFWVLVFGFIFGIILRFFFFKIYLRTKRF
jgi:hypothetical protein